MNQTKTKKYILPVKEEIAYQAKIKELNKAIDIVGDWARNGEAIHALYHRLEQHRLNHDLATGQVKEFHD
jgi:hypothetical protein